MNVAQGYSSGANGKRDPPAVGGDRSRSRVPDYERARQPRDSRARAIAFHAERCTARVTTPRES